MGETSLPPKPPSVPARPPTPERRRRIPDLDDTGRPPKRPKPVELAGRPIDDRYQGSREENNRRRVQDHSTSRDQTRDQNLRDAKPTSSSLLTSLPNGRHNAKTSNSNYSPPPRVRGESSSDPRAAGSEDHRGTPTKTKRSVPPLLSPLHLDFDDSRDYPTTGNTEKRSRGADVDGDRPTKSKQNEAQGGSKRLKSPLPLKLLPLLSPTLPPEIEEELERRKTVPLKLSESQPQDERDSISPRKKAVVQASESKNKDEQRKPLIVTLKISKRLRPRFTAYMKLEASTSRKAPPRQDATVSSSTAADAVPPARAEKRPASQYLQEPPVASKRPRTSDASGSSSKITIPSTPSKKGSQAMSRASSSNSMANTPGDAINATPSAPDRLAHPPPRVSMAKMEALRAKEAALCDLGKRLKHKADQTIKGQHMDHNAATNGNVRSNEVNTKIGYVLILESTLAFTMGFHVQDTHRGLANRFTDPSCSWATLLPLLDFLQKEMRRFDQHQMRPVFAISLLLQVLAYDEMLRAYSNHENPPGISVPDLTKSRRKREAIITQLREVNSHLSGDLYANVTLWSTVEDVAEMSLAVIKSWCVDEGIEYHENLNLREMGMRHMGRI